MDDPLSYWLIILSTLLFSAFFSGMEIAFISANRMKIEIDKNKGKYAAKQLSKWVQRPSRFIGTMLVGNNIALVVFTIFMEKVLKANLFPDLQVEHVFVALIVNTVASTLIILIAAEFIPKTLFRINPNWVLSTFMVPLQFLHFFLLFIPRVITVGLSELLLRLFSKEASSEQQEVAFGRVDLNNYVRDIAERSSRKEKLDHEVLIMQNALDFSNVKARDCMVPRTEIKALNLEEDISKVCELFINTGLSKILIYRDNIDNLIGYVHSSELFKHPESIKSILLPLTIVPETMPANEVLEQLLKKNRSIAVVVDEFGGTSGMLTMEDIVEEIFGEIEDEHDQEELIEEQLAEGEYVFSARLEIQYLNQEYKLELPEEEDYDTLAGFILHHTESIPQEGDQIQIDSFRIEIIKRSETRIEKVLLQIKG